MNATNAGNLLVFTSVIYRDGISTSATQAAPTGGESGWTACPNFPTHLFASGHGTSNTGCYYKLSSAGGTTSETFNWNFTAGDCGAGAGCFGDVWMFEIHPSATAVYDNDSSSTNGGSACSTCTAPSPTLSGTSDYCVQTIGSSSGTISSASISNSFTTPAPQLDSTNIGAATAGKAQATACAATWTISSSNSVVMGAIAFK